MAAAPRQVAALLAVDASVPSPASTSLSSSSSSSSSSAATATVVSTSSSTATSVTASSTSSTEQKVAPKATKKVDTYSSLILHSGDAKYIIGRLVNQATKAVTHILVSIDLHFHSQIVREYESKHIPAGHTLTVLGGGIITIDQAAKTIRTYGKSGGYGRPDRNQVETILQKSPQTNGYLLTITVTDYVRD